MFARETRPELSEDRIVAALTVLTIVGVAASATLGLTGDGLLHVAYWATGSGGLAGGASGGTGAVIAAGINAAELSGLALAGAVTGGVATVIAVGA